MDNIIVKPRNKEEFELVHALMERMNIKSSVQKKENLRKKRIKEEFLNSLPERLNEVKLHMEGKIELKNAKDLLDEL